MCVLCGGCESVKHLLEDCQGTKSDEREELIRMGLKNARSIMEAYEKDVLPAVVAYLKQIIELRKQRL